MNEGQVVGRKFVVTRRDPPTLFDPIEEPFDQVARTVEVRAEANGLVAIASRRNVERFGDRDITEDEARIWLNELTTPERSAYVVSATGAAPQTRSTMGRREPIGATQI